MSVAWIINLCDDGRLFESMSLLSETLALEFKEDLKPFGGSFSSDDGQDVSTSWNRLLHLSQELFWDLRGGVQTLSVNGTEADFSASSDHGGDVIRWTYRIEKPWLEDLLENLREDDVLFDVGANLGFYACFASQKLQSGHVVAFEPYPPNLEQLRENVDLNGNGTRVVDVALSDTSGVMEFESPESRDVGHATGTVTTSNGSDGHAVRTRTADRMIEDGELPQPNVVKIDVEGSEPRVIEGMRSALEDEACRLVYLEIHLPKPERASVRDHGSSAEQLQQELIALGYTLVDVEKRNRELHVKARK